MIRMEHREIVLRGVTTVLGMRLTSCVARAPAAEGSSSRGVLVEDVFAFPDVADRVWNDSSSHLRMVFGCEEKETGEIYKYVVRACIRMHVCCCWRTMSLPALSMTWL